MATNTSEREYRIPSWDEYCWRHSEDGRNHDLQRMADVAGEPVHATTPRGTPWETFTPEV